MNTQHALQLAKVGLMAGLVLLAAAGPLAAADLTADERDGYFLWLHSLETTMAAQEASLQSAEVVLYPVGMLPAMSERPRTEGALQQVALALGEIESRPRLLQEPSGPTPLHALNRARNYLQLAEFDSALVWYEKAAERDGAGEYTATVGLETMVAAVASGDSVRAVQQLLATLGSRELADRRAEIELSYRFLIGRADSTNLELLVQETEAHPDLLTGSLAYWQGFSLAWLGRWDASLTQLRTLVAAGGLSQGLDEHQRAWVLVAIPDLMILTGQQAAADPLYRALAASSLPAPAAWATCQTAALDFLAGRYLDAGTAFERICEGSGPDAWRTYACSMAELADEMERLRYEGEPHGAAAYYQR